MSSDPSTLSLDDDSLEYKKTPIQPAMTADELKVHAEANAGKIAAINSNFSKEHTNGISLDLDDETGNREVKVEAFNFETKTETDGRKTKCNQTSSFYQLTVRQARMCDVLAAALDGDPDAINVIVSTRDNKNRLFGYVAKYMQHYNGAKQQLVKRPFKSDDFKACANNVFDADLAEEVWQAKDTFDLIMYCNYIGMTELVHLFCAILAHKMRGKTEEEITAIIKDQATHADEIPKTDDEKKKEKEEQEKRQKEEKEEKKEEL
jgi:hypothetical protein